ncbi:hypothetical protein F441_18415 [Phytophthora nicotianae CJ01A1]|uniref:Transmembrane 9 superfamily member n=5 Tax=Phytophthora nicotianae TaxID=4792 RepID=V9E7V9_PHYNI|nr:hypothetical protein F443_18534 [Phytophthora nicotianae P1569]ETK70824.1 hypothetical protein L915_21849 [Phytophthora nicotianae]ETO72980.1 hypothetical protein F444_11028 [Phytophthora nicotianae P1976]ETP04897.1 hypothetical protein F441_18415 [Phytophthora nicotianae CJ01A1]ETP37532.1 hypothetical protein F442_14661 [Phytophthora nicotianae P10297]
MSTIFSVSTSTPKPTCGRVDYCLQLVDHGASNKLRCTTVSYCQYSTYYYWTRLDVANFIGAMLYFGYMAVISGALALLTGAVGVGASLWFTRKIYASIKVD